MAITEAPIKFVPTNAKPDTGTGYGRPKPTYNERLTHVGPGTPMGELLRRYWQPAALSSEATSTPKKVRLLGEDLILFRDGQGRAGLVAENCCHRGTSLFFGRVEDDGIRCCYHGWKFDVQGHCLDQATEVDGGRHREAARQPWYPVEERYGLLFVYMGPPDKKPVLPRYQSLETVPEGEVIEISTNPGFGDSDVLPFNWLQAYENAVDQMHVVWLHIFHSGFQFTFESDDLVHIPADIVPHGMVESTVWKMLDGAVTATSTIPSLDGSGELIEQTVACILPNGVSVPGFNDMAWVVPIDDTHHKVIQIAACKPGSMAKRVEVHDGRRWEELTPEERQKMPGDFEAQGSQGPINFHSREHLATSDQGVMFIRRGLMKMLDTIEAGKDPQWLSFDPNEPPRPPVSVTFHENKA